MRAQLSEYATFVAIFEGPRDTDELQFENSFGGSFANYTNSMPPISVGTRMSGRILPIRISRSASAGRRCM